MAVERIGEKPQDPNGENYELVEVKPAESGHEGFHFEEVHKEDLQPEEPKKSSKK